MAEFYVSDNKIYMDDGTVSLHIADLRPELTETLKAEIEDVLKKEGSKYDDLFSRLYKARRALDEAIQRIGE